MMRAFARSIQRQQLAARSSFPRRQRGFATVNTNQVKGLTVIDHHYEHVLLSQFTQIISNRIAVPLSSAQAEQAYELL
jgi:hypothetical protein